MTRSPSALYWLPRIEAEGLPVPKTVVLPYEHGVMPELFDGLACAEFDRLVPLATEAAARFGGPVFVRTDLAAAKHAGSEAYRVPVAELGAMANALYRTIEDNAMKFWLGPEEPRAILLREWLDLPAEFTVFGGLPISREWRIFANAVGVRCWHPYWPEGAVTRRVDPGYPDWQRSLRDLHQVPLDLPQLLPMAKLAAAVCDGEWSVDFAQDRSGQWWLIDMAPAEVSWHWPGCAAV